MTPTRFLSSHALPVHSHVTFGNFDKAHVGARTIELEGLPQAKDKQVRKPESSNPVFIDGDFSDIRIVVSETICILESSIRESLDLVIANDPDDLRYLAFGARWEDRKVNSFDSIKAWTRSCEASKGLAQQLVGIFVIFLASAGAIPDATSWVGVGGSHGESQYESVRYTDREGQFVPSSNARGTCLPAWSLS